jgi:hypothetical protein
MAAISALAEHSERVDKIMISNDYEPNGIYAMNLYNLGIPFTSIIDDYMPVWDGTNNLTYAQLGKDRSFWAATVEKHMAKWYGNYEHTVGGWMNLAVAALNGSPWEEKQHSYHNKEQIWSFINDADQDNDIITAGSNFCGSHNETTDWGVACSHAYTIIHTVTIQKDG